LHPDPVSLAVCEAHGNKRTVVPRGPRAPSSSPQAGRPDLDGSSARAHELVSERFWRPSWACKNSRKMKEKSHWTTPGATEAVKPDKVLHETVELLQQRAGALPV